MYPTYEMAAASTPARSAPRCEMQDPLAADESADAPLLTTRRRLTRLALVAVETATRFQREGVEYDPMAWLQTPRDLFDGHDAIEAALDLRSCVRAILLHGLGLGLDADPALIDYLTEDDGRWPQPRRPRKGRSSRAANAAIHVECSSYGEGHGAKQ